jgi:hypothetical protein
MGTDDIGELVRSAADSVRKRPAGRKRANMSYSLTVKAGYEEILGLREDGYSYDLICEAFAENGLLPERANPKTLCSAFLREKKRREKKARLIGKVKKEAIPDTPNAEPAKPHFAADLTEKKEMKILAMPAKAGKEESIEGAKEELMRKLASPAEKTGLGKLTKYSDGSFDFDWK